MGRLYHYVGPAEINARAVGLTGGVRIATVEDFLAWLNQSGRERLADGLLAATFVVDRQGELLFADRRSEHVACAGGDPVLSAGEMFFRVRGEHVEAAEASNQSTGFCPEPESWSAVGAALDRLGVAHPGRFTMEVLFRRCEQCGERNIVKDGWFVCGVCGADLPAGWNF